jgi:hypothetical protein
MSLHAGGYSKFTWSDGPLYISDLPSDNLGALRRTQHRAWRTLAADALAADGRPTADPGVGADAASRGGWHHRAADPASAVFPARQTRIACPLGPADAHHAWMPHRGSAREGGCQ